MGIKGTVKRTKIDWDNIKVRTVPADPEHPNELNPYAKLSSVEREQATIALCGKIMVRYVREELEKAFSKDSPVREQMSFV